MVSKAKKESDTSQLKREIANLTKIVKDIHMELERAYRKIEFLELENTGNLYKIKALQINQGDIWDNIEEIEAKINVKCNSKPQNNTDC